MPMLFGLALDRASQVRLAAGQMSLHSALRVSWVVSLTAGSIGALATLALLVAEPVLQTKADTASFALALVMMPVTLAFTFQLRLQTALRRFRDYLATTMTLGASNALLVALAVCALGLGAKGALVALLLSYGIGSWLGFARIVRSSNADAHAEKRVDWRALRAYGVRSYPAVVGHAIDLNLGTVILSVLATKSEIGLFAAVSALVQRFLIVPQSFQEAVLPRIAADPEGRTDLVAGGARIAFSVTLIAVLGFLLMRRPLVTMLLSRDFLPALPLLWWMGAGIAVHASSALLMPYFDGTGRPEVVSLSIWVALLVNTVATLVLYPIAGVTAAAIGFFFSLLSRFLVLYSVFRRSTGVPLVGVLIPSVKDIAMLRAVLTSSRP